MSTFNLQDRLSALMTTATTAGATDGVNAEYADTYPIENELEVEEMSVRQMEEKLDGGSLLVAFSCLVLWSSSPWLFLFFSFPSLFPFEILLLIVLRRISARG